MPRSTKKKYLRHSLLAIVMVAVATFLLYWCFRQVDLSLFWRELFRIHPLALLAAVASILGIIVANAAKWNIFVPRAKRPAFRQLVEAASITLMVANMIPWGRAVGVYLLARIKTIRAALALSVMTLDQFIGGLSKALVYALVLATAPMPSWFRNALIAFIALMLLLYPLLMFLAYRFREPTTKKMESHKGFVNRISYLFSEWAYHMHGLRDWRKKIAGLFFAVLMRCGEVAAIYLVQVGFGMDLPLWSPWLIVAAVNLAIFIPITPGNLGVFEAVVFYIYKYIGIEPTQAMTLAVFHHLVYVAPLLVPGYILTVKRGIKIGRALESREAASLYTQETS